MSYIRPRFRSCFIINPDDLKISLQFLDSIIIDDSSSLLNSMTSFSPDSFTPLFTFNCLFSTSTTPYPELTNGPTLPQLSVFFGSLHCFDLLTDLSFPLTSLDNNGRSISHFAAMHGDLAFIRRLAQLDIDFTSRDFQNYSCCDYAARYGRLDCLQWLDVEGLIPPSSADECLVVLCERGYLNCLRYFYEQRSIQLYPELLDAACKFGHSRVIEYLINHKMRVVSRHLEFAVESGSPSALKCILENGVFSVSKMRKVLNSAARQGFLDLALILVAFGTPPHQLDEIPPIWLAFVNGHFGFARCFRKKFGIRVEGMQIWISKLAEDGEIVLKFARFLGIADSDRMFWDDLMLKLLEDRKMGVIVKLVENGFGIPDVDEATYCERKAELIDEFPVVNSSAIPLECLAKCITEKFGPAVPKLLAKCEFKVAIGSPSYILPYALVCGGIPAFWKWFEASGLELSKEDVGRYHLLLGTAKAINYVGFRASLKVDSKLETVEPVELLKEMKKGCVRKIENRMWRKELVTSFSGELLGVLLKDGKLRELLMVLYLRYAPERLPEVSGYPSAAAFFESAEGTQMVKANAKFVDVNALMELGLTGYTKHLLRTASFRMFNK
jgi:hypothetical protein